jgi:phosphoglycolate phosphatase
MPGIKAVLFDKDGTLVDFNRTWGPAAHAVVTRLADGHPARLAGLMEAVGFVPGGTDLAPRSFVVSDPTSIYGRRWAAILEREATDAFFALIDNLFAEEVLRSITPIPAARPAIERLARRGLPMGIATNDAEANARQQMRHLDLDGHLPFIAGYDSGHGAKPLPGMALAFARHAGVAPDEVALIGDTLHDLHAAKAAGARAVAVLTGLTGEAARDHLAPHADIVIASLDELDAALD